MCTLIFPLNTSARKDELADVLPKCHVRLRRMCLVGTDVRTKMMCATAPPSDLSTNQFCVHRSLPCRTHRRKAALRGLGPQQKIIGVSGKKRKQKEPTRKRQARLRGKTPIVTSGLSGPTNPLETKIGSVFIIEVVNDLKEEKVNLSEEDMTLTMWEDLGQRAYFRVSTSTR